MTKTRLQIFALGVVLASVGAVAGAAPRPARGAGDTTLAAIAGYRQWTRVTRKPVEVPLMIETGGLVEIGSLAVPAI